MHTYTYIYINTYDAILPLSLCYALYCYGAALVSKIDEIIGLFCKRDL